MLTAVGAAGCGDPGAASVEAFNRAKGVVRVNYEPHTPRQLADEAAVVVYGTVKTVRDGSKHKGGPTARTVVIGIDPTDVVKDDPAREGDLVYAEVGRVEGDNVDDIADALPAGTPIAVFGADATDQGVEVDGSAGTGREPGSTVYVPFPQGLWFETPSGLESVLTDPAATGVDGWAGISSWDALKDAATQ